MQRDQVIAALKAHEQELRTAGVEGVSLFGSLARGEKSAGDVDLAVRLGEGFSAPGLDYLSRLGELEGRLSGILGCKVDVDRGAGAQETFPNGDRPGPSHCLLTNLPAAGSAGSGRPIAIPAQPAP